MESVTVAIVEKRLKQAALRTAAGRRLRKAVVEQRQRDRAREAFDRWAAKAGAVRFIQVGSNDGESNDPLVDHIGRYEWHGVLVEPVPHLLEMARQRHHGNDRLTFVEAAIGPEEGELPFYFVAGTRENDPPWVEQIGTLSRQHLLDLRDWVPDIEKRIEQMRVRVMTLRALVDEVGHGSIDLLHVDAEGVDFMVLDQLSSLAQQPSAVLYEHDHMSRDHQAELIRRWARGGYRVTVGKYDTFAVR